MLLLNENTDYRTKLEPADAETLSLAAAEEVERFLNHREGHKATPLVSLSHLAEKLGVASIHIKDEGHRLGLGSFKALGGSYAVIRLVLEQASRDFGREVDISERHRKVNGEGAWLRNLFLGFVHRRAMVAHSSMAAVRSSR